MISKLTSIFSRSVSPERSDLSSHYGVRMCVCLSVCVLDVTFSVKGKIFDNRFGLIHVRTQKNFFSSLHLTLHLFISLISDNTRFGLIHVGTQKKFFFICSSLHLTLHLFISLISDNTRFGLIHVQTKKKFFFICSSHLTLHLFISLISDDTRFGLIHFRTQKTFSSSVHLSHSSSLHLTNFR